MEYLREYGGGSHQNERMTLQQKVSVSDVLSEISNPLVRDTLKRFALLGSVNLWDVGKRASRHLKAGDDLYILCADHLYHGKILEKIHDPQGEIGDRIGWHPIHKHPWQNPLVLTELQQEPMGLLNELGPRLEVSRNFYRICPAPGTPGLN